MTRTALLVVAMVGDLAIGVRVEQPADPVRTLSERFQFSAAEVAQVSGGQPVARLISTAAKDELAVVGALRLDGDMHRLAGWVRDIAAFRKAAELGHAKVVTEPITEAAFTDFTLDPRDVAALRTCRVGSCELRLPERALQQLQTDVHWDDPSAGAQADRLLRQVLAGYLQAYIAGGDAALGSYHNRKNPRAAADDFRELLAGATNLKLLVPELADYLEKFPGASLPGVDQLLYWTSVTDGSEPVFSLHHLVVYPRAADDVLIADKTIYSSRTFEAGALVLSMQKAADGRGYYVIGAARVKSSKLTGMAARVLRSRVEKATIQGVETYLAWIRDSLALDTPRGHNFPAPPHPPLLPR